MERYRAEPSSGPFQGGDSWEDVFHFLGWGARETLSFLFCSHRPPLWDGCSVGVGFRKAFQLISIFEYLFNHFYLLEREKQQASALSFLKYKSSRIQSPELYSDLT